MPQKHRVVVAFGTFDLLHPGHKYYLERARSYGDELVVIVARDETVLRAKGHYPLRDDATRRESVERLPVVARAVIGHPSNHFRFLDEFRPDVIALGYDQRFLTRNLKPELRKRRLRTQIVRIDAYRPEQYKTSILRKRAPASSPEADPGDTSAIPGQGAEPKA